MNSMGSSIPPQMALLSKAARTLPAGITSNRITLAAIDVGRAAFSPLSLELTATMTLAGSAAR